MNYFFIPPSHTSKSLARNHNARTLGRCFASNPLAQLCVQPAALWSLWQTDWKSLGFISFVLAAFSIKLKSVCINSLCAVVLCKNDPISASEYATGNVSSVLQVGKPSDLPMGHIY